MVRPGFTLRPGQRRPRGRVLARLLSAAWFPAVVLASPAVLLLDLVRGGVPPARRWIAGYLVLLTLAGGAAWGSAIGLARHGERVLSALVDPGGDRIELTGVPYAEHIRRFAAEQNLDPALLAAMIRRESGFDPRAVSPAGAMGLMQIRPDIWQAYNPQPSCSDPDPPEPGLECVFDPATNIRTGARYLRRLLDAFDGDPVLAIAAYNAGINATRRYIRENPGGLAPFPATRAFVHRVLESWAAYRAGEPLPDPGPWVLVLGRLRERLPGLVAGLWLLFCAWVVRRWP